MFAKMLTDVTKETDNPEKGILYAFRISAEVDAVLVKEAKRLNVGKNTLVKMQVCEYATQLSNR